MGQPLLILYNKPSSSPVLDSLPALPGSLPAYSSTLGVLGPQPLPTKGTEQVSFTLPAPSPRPVEPSQSPQEGPRSKWE